MATYALTFATRAAFDTSLVSGDIYNLMQGVTSSKPSVAITATITESGETFACGTNVMVDIKSVGPGDCVMYDSTNNKFFGIASKWIDNNYPNQPTQHIMIYKAGVLPAGFVLCGTVIKRFGNRIRLAGDAAYLAWAGGGWPVPSLKSTSSAIKKSRSSTNNIITSTVISFPSLRYAEARFPEGSANYFPILRTTWNSAVAAGSESVTENGKTQNLLEFNNNYDKFLDNRISILFPSANGVNSDTDGFGNTKKIVSEFIANHSKTETSADYAAGYCYNYTPGNAIPGLEKHSWFLGTVKDVGEVISIQHTLLSASAWGSRYYWTSCNNNDNNAWCLHNNGYTVTYSKTVLIYIVPLADLILNT